MRLSLTDILCFCSDCDFSDMYTMSLLSRFTRVLPVILPLLLLPQLANAQSPVSDADLKQWLA